MSYARSLIHDFIINSNFTKHFDETGWRNNGKRHYAWIATCKQAAIYKVDRRRNKLAFQKLLKNLCTGQKILNTWVTPFI